MAIIKCKMCGGDLNLTEGQSVAECEYCGSVQTVPAADNEKKLTLFARANRLRAACEFDKAAGIYETIVADFPEEAESYWGLVLCKYGIEYVDDPATGNKIPTCHRSSFDSVLEDNDFEQALENADPVARKVYRDEAKQLEEIRKGIIAVSANEQPYDIFICYKETASNGDRTLDSVLAQDIYEALTGKGYRVFFSRITLEDKLGQEYEPYIFAALNSAKIMLAIGTDYEYYNAVWVKNEWSRYLKLMAKDKDKHLIPCYKGIDAYDMPKEFNKLQAQDMGKVGADQDLLRGIEKLLPKQTATIQTQDGKLVSALGPNLDSLIRRAETFVEDAEWKKAEKYYDNILDTNPECAQAYLGKCLVQQQAVSLAVLIEKRFEKYSKDIRSTDSVQRDTEREEQLLSKYALGKYLPREDLEELLKCDMQYTSTAGSWDKHLATEKQFFASDRYMGRAVRFATGNTKIKVEAARKQALDALENKLVEAQRAGEEQRRLVMERYEQTMQEAEITAEKLYEQAQEVLQADLNRLYGTMQSSNDIGTLKDVLKELKEIHGIQPIAELVRICEQKLNFRVDEKRKEEELNDEISAAHRREMSTNPELQELREQLQRSEDEHKRLSKYTYGKRYSFGYLLKWNIGMLIRTVIATLAIGFLLAVLINVYADSPTLSSYSELIHEKSFVWAHVIALIVTFISLRGIFNKEKEKAKKKYLAYLTKENKFLKDTLQKKEEELSLDKFRVIYLNHLRNADSKTVEAEREQGLKKLKKKISKFRSRHGGSHSKGILAGFLRILLILILAMCLAIAFVYDVRHYNLLMEIPADIIPEWFPTEWMRLNWIPKGWVQKVFSFLF